MALSPGEKSPLIMGENSMNVLIVGGSLSGLMNGVMMKRLGHNVHILEQYQSSVRSGHAAGIRAGPQVQEFFKNHDLSRQPYSLDCPGIQFIDRNSNRKRFVNNPMCMTSWEYLYYRLRANFDGYASQYCEKPPASAKTDGKVVYDLGKRVTNVSYIDGSVLVTIDDTINGGSTSLSADLVIASDGSSSTVRQMVSPTTQHPYAGYVAWRGTVPEKEASDETNRICAGGFTIFKMNLNYILVYIIPGENGSLLPGSRLLNFVWYYNCASSSAEYASIMTDSSSHRHRRTLPPGKMRAEVWEKQKAHAEHVLAPPFAELVRKTKQPFISSVSDAMAPRAVFFDGKLLLVGEALASFRPHIAMSANQAALNCLCLEKVLKGEMGLGEWEREVMQYATATRALSTAYGNYAQVGGLTFVLSVFSYLFILVQQKLLKLWGRLF